jgi:hypothetical protein
VDPVPLPLAPVPLRREQVAGHQRAGLVLQRQHPARGRGGATPAQPFEFLVGELRLHVRASGADPGGAPDPVLRGGVPGAVGVPGVRGVARTGGIAGARAVVRAVVLRPGERFGLVAGVPGIAGGSAFVGVATLTGVAALAGGWGGHGWDAKRRGW